MMANNLGYKPLATGPSPQPPGPPPQALDPAFIQNVLREADARLNHVLSTPSTSAASTCVCPAPSELTAWGHLCALISITVSTIGNAIYYMLFEADWLSVILNICTMLLLVFLLWMTYQVLQVAYSFLRRDVQSSQQQQLQPSATGVVRYAPPSTMFTSVVMMPSSKKQT
jgi:hypothetical protein